MLTQEELRVADQMILALRQRGTPRGEACRIVSRAIARVKSSAPSSGGVGQPEILKSAAEAAPVKAVREAVSPWLWVLSVVGFGLTILNTRRIARMFKKKFG